MEPKTGEWTKIKPSRPCLFVRRLFYDGWNYQLLQLNYLVEDKLTVLWEDYQDKPGEWEEFCTWEELTADDYYVVEYFGVKPEISPKSVDDLTNR